MPSLRMRTTPEQVSAELDKFDVVAVHGVIESSDVRPIDAFRSLRVLGEPGFIFESESPEAGASRFSYVCTSVEKVVRTGANESSGDVSPTSELRSNLGTRSVAPIGGIPALVTGAFGFISYEAISHFEPSLGTLPEDPTGSPMSAMIFPKELLVFDRLTDDIHTLIFTSSAEELDEIQVRIEEICRTLSADRNHVQLAASLDGVHVESAPSSGDPQFPRMVNDARRAIIEGELIQVVLGQRIERQTTANAVDIYEQLSGLNPSPYMFMLDLGDMQLVGASPELLLRSTNGVASIHPIAGTRPRGESAEEDLQYEADLLSNEKESAEHVMLVDLARNDLGRVCEPGSVVVSSLKHIERYSHVMHLVSRVQGTLSPHKDGIDAFESGFPIGTLSGAPKIRSIQLIAELEPEGRGPYCGGIGWFGANGDVDTGTIIRSIVLRDNAAHIQGGAGIVFDSDPQAETLESLQKAKAPLLAIERAEAIQSQKHRCWRSEDPTSPATPQVTTISAD